jgi:aspartate carbamoyltransferase catalytic subunit
LLFYILAKGIKMKRLGSVVFAQQFEKSIIEEIFYTTHEMEEQKTSNVLCGKIMAALFYEPSTRTRLSFESAMLRLGGSVIGTESAKTFSSKAKGESLEDSVRVISGYCDVIVLRYYKEGGAKRAKDYATVPIINAGDGAGQHPTQALLDLYTIKKSFGDIRGLKIAMIGDLANGRTVHSLAYFLAKHFSDNEIIFVSPSQVCMKDEIKEYLDKYGVHWREKQSLKNVVSEADVFYQTRVQEERFKKDISMYKKVIKARKKLIITPELVSRMKRRAIIMHPLPRNEEIVHAVDNDPCAKYFEQAQNGLYVRMALLKMILT